MLDQAILDTVSGIAPEELDDWYESLEDILHRYGPEKLRELLVHLQERAYARCDAAVYCEYPLSQHDSPQRPSEISWQSGNGTPH